MSASANKIATAHRLFADVRILRCRPDAWTAGRHCACRQSAEAQRRPKLRRRPPAGAISAGRDKEACLVDERTAEGVLAQNWSKYNACRQDPMRWECEDRRARQLRGIIVLPGNHAGRESNSAGRCACALGAAVRLDASPQVSGPRAFETLHPPPYPPRARGRVGWGAGRRRRAAAIYFAVRAPTLPL